jgi:hypothetical protein
MLPRAKVELPLISQVYLFFTVFLYIIIIIIILLIIRVIKAKFEIYE